MSSSKDLRGFYNSVFTMEGGGSWEDAPGKAVFIQALQSYLNEGRISSDSQIVEIGCGSGGLLSRINEEVIPNEFDLYGVDFSNEAVRLCRNKHKYIRVFCEDGSNTHFEDEQFDVVVSYGAYEHFTTPQRAIEELGRILRVGGVFLCMMPTLGIYRTDRTDEGWYEDLSPNAEVPRQMQWNLLRTTWEAYFSASGLILDSIEQTKHYGAEKPGVFFFGTNE
ncbi:MAG: class I SAM-dependent methyltransferase [Bacteroidia bacterium]|nr:class I SAM-dependent methyltransferase [Bacteroidia bacterium]